MSYDVHFFSIGLQSIEFQHGTVKVTMCFTHTQRMKSKKGIKKMKIFKIFKNIFFITGSLMIAGSDCIDNDIYNILLKIVLGIILIGFSYISCIYETATRR